MDNKTIGVSSLVTLGIVTMVMLVPGFFDDPQYFCESRPELGLVSCDNFSKYVSEVGKCIRNEDTNLICRDGWVLVTKDIELPEEEDIEDPIINIPNEQVIGHQYICSPEKCEMVQ